MPQLPTQQHSRQARAESATLTSGLLTRPELVALHLESLDPHFEDVDGKGVRDLHMLLSVTLVRIPDGGLQGPQRAVGGLKGGLCKGRAE